GSADWTTAGNWSTALPGSTDIGLFNGARNPSDGLVGFGNNANVGAISLTGSASSITFGNLGGSAHTLTLNSTTVNAVANTILANTTTAATTLSIIAHIGGSKTLGVSLGGTNNVIQVSSSNVVSFSVGMDENTVGSNVTIQGGGKVIFGAGNTYTGTTFI